MPTIWSSVVNKAILEHVKVAEYWNMWKWRNTGTCQSGGIQEHGGIGLWLNAWISAETKTMFIKLILVIVQYIKFHIKGYLQSNVYISYLYHLFGIICKSIFYNPNNTWNYWFISKNVSWDPGILSCKICLTYYF